MKINFFEYQKLYLENKNQYKKIFDDVCARGAFILQKDLENFEKELAKFLKVKYAIGINDGTNALIISLMANNIGNGDEVIVPSHTYIASAASIKLVGAIPVFADIDLYDNLVDPKDIEKKITKKTKAIMPVHVNGRICDMSQIVKISKKYKLKIIEDGAQAIGAMYKGKSIGSFGNCSSISFYPAKVLGCFGDGGAIVTNNNKLFKKLKLLRDHGRDEKGDIKLWGTNARLDNLQAAFLNFKLKDLKNIIRTRREIANLYHKRLSNLKELVLPPKPNENNSRFDVFQNFEIRAKKRDGLKKYLKRNKIGTLIQWSGKGVHQIKSLKINAKLPKTNLFFKETIMLPIHPFLSKQEINYICDKILLFYKIK